MVWGTGEHWGGTTTGDLSSDGGGGYLYLRYLQVRLQSNYHGTYWVSSNHNPITQIYMNKLSGHNADVSGIIVGLLVFELQIYSFTIKLQLNAELTEKTLQGLAKTLLRMKSSVLDNIIFYGGFYRRCPSDLIIPLNNNIILIIIISMFKIKIVDYDYIRMDLCPNYYCTFDNHI